MDNFIEWRLIKNPVTGEKDTVIGTLRNGGDVPMLIDNPVYLEWVAQGGIPIEEQENA
jgi:hypothetical protein